MVKKIITLLSIFYFSLANAGINNLTAHSRANCINNESITWQLGKRWVLRTVSEHYKNKGLAHTIDTHWDRTRRSAAVCWLEGKLSGDWHVIGKHYIIYDDKPNKIILFDETETNNCNIVEGWW